MNKQQFKMLLIVLILPVVTVKNIDVLYKYYGKNCQEVNADNRELCNSLIKEINDFKKVDNIEDIKQQVIIDKID